MARAAKTVIHLSPHPDDEAIGAPATLLALRAAGHRVVNVVCSLGRTGQHERRRAEAEEAARRADFGLVIPEPPIGLSQADDLERAGPRLLELISEALQSHRADLVVCPSPHDRHPAHEMVARAARDAIASSGGPRLWLWGVWGDLPLPTLFFPFGDAELDAATEMLAAYAGEVERNDYVDLVRCRAVSSRVLGAERVFGFGEPALPHRYAELMTEVAFAEGEWWAGAPRIPDSGDFLAEVPRDRPVGWWMHGPSFTSRLQGATAAGHGCGRSCLRPPPTGSPSHRGRG